MPTLKESALNKIAQTKKPRLKKIIIVLISTTVIFFLAGGVLGYLYFQKSRNYNDLQNEKQRLEQELKTATSDLQKQYQDLEKRNQKLIADKKELQKANQQLEKELADKESKSNKIKAYNDVLDYIMQTMEAHNGLNGISEGEYQVGLAKARKTGDSDFVNTVEWAWHSKSISQTERLARVINEIIDNINANL